MAGIGLAAQYLQQGQREASGLAGAGLRGAEQIFAGENDGDGLRLDGGGRGVALVRDCAEQLGLEPERIKGTNGNSPALGLGRREPSTGSGRCVFSLLLSDPGWIT